MTAATREPAATPITCPLIASAGLHDTVRYDEHCEDRRGHSLYDSHPQNHVLKEQDGHHGQRRHCGLGSIIAC